ncbi:MAG: hypothetical protein ACOCYA_06495, partial [Spirochaetota bacterium]
MRRKSNQYMEGAGTLQFRSMSDAALVRLFILPTIILLILINIFPLLWSLILSFSNFSARLPTEWGKN